MIVVRDVYIYVRLSGHPTSSRRIRSAHYTAELGGEIFTRVRVVEVHVNRQVVCDERVLLVQCSCGSTGSISIDEALADMPSALLSSIVFRKDGGPQSEDFVMDARSFRSDTRFRVTTSDERYPVWRHYAVYIKDALVGSLRAYEPDSMPRSYEMTVQCGPALRASVAMAILKGEPCTLARQNENCSKKAPAKAGDE
jgi:hypothetical protein